MPTIRRIVYASLSRGVALAHVMSIRRSAESFNGANGVTGALVATQERFVQLLEGGAPEIDALYARIMADSRHVRCTLLCDELVPFRLCPSWFMRLLSEQRFRDKARELGLDPAKLPEDIENSRRWAELMYLLAQEIEYDEP